MKKLLFAACVALLLMGCEREPKKLLSTVVYQDSINRTLTEGSRFSMTSGYEVSYFESKQNPELAAKINSVILRKLFGDELAAKTTSIPEACAAFQELLYSDYVADNSDVMEDEGEEYDFMHNYEYDTKGYTVYESASRMSYCVEQYMYLGGAHGVNTRLFTNFALPSGDILTQDDILQGNYREPMHLLMLRKIVEQDDDVALVKDIEEKGYYPQEIYPNDNFYFTDSTIVYVFNPYDIGPYAFGEIEIELSFDELKDYIK